MTLRVHFFLDTIRGSASLEKVNRYANINLGKEDRRTLTKIMEEPIVIKP